MISSLLSLSKDTLTAFQKICSIYIKDLKIQVQFFALHIILSIAFLFPAGIPWAVQSSHICPVSKEGVPVIKEEASGGFCFATWAVDCPSKPGFTPFLQCNVFSPLFAMKSAEMKDTQQRRTFDLLKALEILRLQDTWYLFNPPLLWEL